MSPRLLRCLLFFACASVAAFGAEIRAESRPAALAANGRASIGIVVAAKASPRVRQAATTLANYLGRIGECQFEVNSGDGRTGIAVGLATDFPGISLAEPFDEKDPTRREDYLLQSHDRGVYVLGATELAVEHAVWDLLWRLGYRQYFPGPHWEIVPHERKLAIAVDAREHPDYLARRIWYGYGLWDYNKEPYEDWCAKNRATSGIELNTGHAYERIIRDNKAEFAVHPEYLGLVDGKRTSTKFCISNPGLRKLVVQWALRQFAEDPSLDSISCEPSDGAGWCQCEQCAKLGSVSDRALLLANDVAAAVNQEYPGKLVGMLAYNYHSPPPDIRADPHVVVTIAAGFIKGGLTLDEIINGWSAKAHLLGIYDYYEVAPWDHDLPAKARSGNIDYLKRTIPEFHARGAQFFCAESGDSWGPDGLGFYLAARMMWDVGEARRIDSRADDFLTRAFGEAKKPMREFFRQLDGSQPHLVASDQLGQMFRSLEVALRLSKTPAVHDRLADLLLYCRYVELFNRYEGAKGAERQAAFEALIRHAYRMRKTMLVHTKALYRDLPAHDKNVLVPPEAQINVPQGKNPWKSSRPFSEEELALYLKEGIERYPLSKIDFKPVAFGEDLVSAAKLKLPEPAASAKLGAVQGEQTFFTRIESAPAAIHLLVTGGLIAWYRDRGNVHLELFKIGGVSAIGERETLAAEDRSVPPDGKERAVELTVKEPGLYKLTLSGGGDSSLLKWNCALPLTIKSTLDEPMNVRCSGPLYFYVPRGTRVLGLFGGKRGEIRDSAGRSVFSLNGREINYYSVAIPGGEDGKLWSAFSTEGPLRLLTVPPCFAPKAAELLLPAEVVEKDAGKR